MPELAQYIERAAILTNTLKTGLFDKARRIRLVADWLEDQEATRQVRKLQEKYAPLVAQAEKEQDWNTQQSLLSEWDFDSDAVLDPVYGRKGERLAAKALRYGITVPPKPRNSDERNDDWRLSRVHGFWLPRAVLVQRLQREIRVEQRTSYDEFRKWATLAFAVAGFLLAFYSVRTAKQPDPCQRNYYRSDSGDCVLVTQKTSPPLSKPSPGKEVARARP